VNALTNDFRYALRSIVRYRALTGAAVACMVLGIGVSATLFGSVNPWLFRPLPYPRPDRLVGLRETEPEGGDRAGRTDGVSGPNYLDWRQRSRSFVAIGAYDRTQVNLSAGDVPERIHAARVTWTLFPTLQIQPVRGRGFADEEDRPQGPRVALISHRLWQERFDGNPAVVGGTLTLDGAPHVVVGVMPPGFAYPEYAEVWTPLGLRADGARDDHGLEVVARLADGVAVERAQGELVAIAAALAREYPDTNEGRGARVQPLLEGLTPPGVVVGLALFLVAGLFVQLIACANVANLLLAKAMAQRREVALRLALGAGRGRLLRQFMIEALLLSVAGAGLGLLAASWGVRQLIAGSPVRPPFWVVHDLDQRALAFVVAVTCASALLVGLVPALQAGRTSVLDALREDSRTVAGGPRGRLGRLLVVSELATALVLLVGAALMVQSFARRYETDPGFDTRSALTARLSLSGDAYADPARRADFLEELVRRLRARPEVVEAGVANGLPFSDPLSGGWWERRFEVEGRPVERGHEPAAVYYSVNSAFMRALGIRLRAGRLFDAEDEADARAVAVISDDLAARQWGGADPVGRWLRVDGGPWLRVVGVAAQTREGGDMLLGDAKPAGQIYVPYRRDSPQAVSLLLRARSNPAELAGALRETLHGLDVGLPVAFVFTLDEVRARASWVAQLWGRTLSQVALIALVLAALGVYGVVSHMVSQRTHEIGIRMALGAARGDVIRLVVRQGMRLVLQAVALGLLAAVAVTGALSRLLYGVEARDPATLIGCALLLALTALFASWAPARRATRVDPVTALRAE
jgi:putative ABC transport system permease protein